MMHPDVAAILDQFAKAVTEAERHRRVLQQRFGLTNKQIGLFVMERQRRTPLQQLAQATLAAKQRLQAKRDAGKAARA